MTIQNSIVTNSSDYLYRTTNLLNHNSNWSASLWFYPTSFSSYAHIFMATAASSPGAGDYINSDFIGHNNANPALLRAMVSYSGNSAATSATLALNTWHFVGITRESATVLKAYINGNTTASISITKDITGRGATALQVLGMGNATYPLFGRIACVKEWDATLTGSEFADEMNKAYAVRTSGLREVFNFVTGANIFVGSENGYTWTEVGDVTEATGPDLEEPSAPSVVVGRSRRLPMAPGRVPFHLAMFSRGRKNYSILSAKATLSGSATGVSSNTGTLRAKGSLSGSSSSAAVTSGNLVGKGILSGSADGIASTSGVIKAKGSISGIASSVSTVGGNLVGSGNLSGLAEGGATANGTLVVPSGKISGSATGIASISGVLTGRGVLNGSADGIATVSGLLKQQTGKISGSSNCVATTTGTLIANGRLSGSDSGLNSSAGSLTAKATLSGSATGVSSNTGTLRAKGSLSGSSSSAAVTSGNLVGKGSLNGSSAGLSVVLGNLNGGGIGILSGSADGIASTSGVIKAKGSISGIASSVSTVGGNLVGSGNLSGLAEGGLSVSFAILSGIGNLFGASAGDSSASINNIERNPGSAQAGMKLGIRLGL